MSTGDQIWIVGSDIKPGAWEFRGAFSSEMLALKACKCGLFFNPGSFLGPALIDVPVPDKPPTWPGCYRPFFLNEITGMVDALSEKIHMVDENGAKLSMYIVGRDRQALSIYANKRMTFRGFSYEPGVFSVYHGYDSSVPHCPAGCDPYCGPCEHYS